MPNASMRSGRTAQIALRRTSPAEDHSVISSPVRPHPRHKPKAPSIVQIPVQGLGMAFV